MSIREKKGCSIILATVAVLVILAQGAAKWLWKARFYAGFDPKPPLNPTGVQSSAVSDGHAHRDGDTNAHANRRTQRYAHQP